MAENYKQQIKNLSEIRESYISRYIIPIEIKMGILRDKIRETDPDYNEY